MTVFKSFTYSNKAIGDIDITDTSVEELSIEGGYSFLSDGSSKNSVTKITMLEGMQDICFFTIIEKLQFIEKNTRNIKIEKISVCDVERKITGKIKLDKFYI